MLALVHRTSIILQVPEVQGLHAAILRCATQASCDIRERALQSIKILLEADGAGYTQILDALGAATELQQTSGCNEPNDVGYREGLLELHTSVIHALVSNRQGASVKDEL